MVLLTCLCIFPALERIMYTASNWLAAAPVGLLRFHAHWK